VKGYDFNRMVVEFTMLNQSKVIFARSAPQLWTILKAGHDVKPEERVAKRLRETFEERASRKFFEEQAQADRPAVLRSIDFR
jgi:hypothetical protein